MSIIVVLLFSFNYLLAEYFYPWSLTDGTLCDANLAFRFNCYSVIALLCFGLTFLDKNKLTNFILSIGFGLVLSDFLDRFLFDVTSFQLNDIVMIIVTILTSYYKYYVRKGSTGIK